MKNISNKVLLYKKLFLKYLDITFIKKKNPYVNTRRKKF